MVRIALLALVLAFGAGEPSLGGFMAMVTAAGSIWDPWGNNGENPSGNVNQPGSDAENDAGNFWDPFG